MISGEGDGIVEDDDDEEVDSDGAWEEMGEDQMGWGGAFMTRTGRKKGSKKVSFDLPSSSFTFSSQLVSSPASMHIVGSQQFRNSFTDTPISADLAVQNLETHRNQPRRRRGVLLRRRCRSLLSTFPPIPTPRFSQPSSRG